MKKLYISVVAILIYSVVFAGNSPGQSAKDPLPGVKANLVISVEEYDPFKPSKGVVKCIVVNKSNNPVEVFLGYDERRNQLRADSGEAEGHPGWELRLRPLKLKEELKRVRVKPGEELAIFEFSLDEILLQGVGEGPRRIDQDRKWGWDWEAKPRAPPSPIHRWDSGSQQVKGFLEKAVFWAQVEVQGKRLSSEKVTLKVTRSFAADVKWPEGNPASFGFQASLPVGTEIWSITEQMGFAGSGRAIILWKSGDRSSMEIVGRTQGARRELSPELAKRIWNMVPRPGDPNLAFLPKDSFEMTTADGLMGWCIDLRTVVKTWHGEWTPETGSYFRIEGKGCIAYRNDAPLRSFLQSLQKELGVSLE